MKTFHPSLHEFNKRSDEFRIRPRPFPKFTEGELPACIKKLHGDIVCMYNKVIEFRNTLQPKSRAVVLEVLDVAGPSTPLYDIRAIDQKLGLLDA